jgi:hypothetical protein
MRAVRRLTTAEDIERVGTEDQEPSDDYFVGFTDGAVVYTVNLFGPPGSVSERRLWKSQTRITTGLPVANARRGSFRGEDVERGQRREMR